MKMMKTQFAEAGRLGCVSEILNVSSRGVAAMTMFDSAVAGRQSCVNTFLTQILDVRSCRERIVPALRPD